MESNKSIKLKKSKSKIGDNNKDKLKGKNKIGDYEFGNNEIDDNKVLKKKLFKKYWNPKRQ